MSNTTRVLASSGGARKDSPNRKLPGVAEKAARAAGAAVTPLEPDDKTFPLYHGGLEATEGLPLKVARLVSLALKHHALLIGSPEYNPFMTPLPKNTLDWMSRPDEKPFAGKVSAAVSASPGAMGGSRSQVHAKQLVMQLDCPVVPANCTLLRAHEGFDTDGSLKDGRTQQSLEALVAELIDNARKIGRVSRG